METLFEDIYTLEQDKVTLAAHCFDKRARVWWRRVKQDRSPNLLPIDWAEFRGLMFIEYFPDSDKRKLKQGNCTVREYKREFTHILNCVPDVARTEQDRAEYFVRGLRPDVFRLVHAFKFHTFTEVLDRALWVEHGNVCIREEHEEFEREKGKKRTGGGSGGRSSSKKPPRYPQERSEGREAQRCIFCGGDHLVMQCEHRRGRRYECSQAGHMARDCPRKALVAPSVAFAPAIPGHYEGAPLIVASIGRALAPRQPEATRSAPSGRVYAARVEEPTVADDVVAGMV
ncbi:uncharacterized protein LOC109722601 [Ananas comosus]|uniref:Uncharacterized protein LOC109722601 n=1 Tax=Ananas comosus TaxID=4615 RepID=A0A6P5GE82_ANACO|nr:uncharacterized protein LOC109722601 [Ananas comosus]